MNTYFIDLTNGHAVFARVIIDEDDDEVKVFSHASGDLIGRSGVAHVASYGTVTDLSGVERYHVNGDVRRMCLGAVPVPDAGLKPAERLPF